MTQSDVREVRRSKKLEPDRDKSSKRFLVGAVIVAALAAITAMVAFAVAGDDEPAGKASEPAFDPYASHLVGDPPNVSGLQGFWRVDNGTQHWVFHPDGTFGYSNVGNAYTGPEIIGTWTLDGDEITLTNTSTSLEGCIGDFFKLRASIPETGRMNFAQTEVSTPGCSPIAPRTGVLEHMLPTEVGEDLIFSTESGFAPLASVGKLPGFWLAERGGYALDLNKSGEYVVADGTAVVVDHGTWTFTDGDLTLASSKNSLKCEPGDRLVLGGVEWVNAGTDAIRGRVTQNTCDAAWTPTAWFLIPDSGS